VIAVTVPGRADSYTQPNQNLDRTWWRTKWLLICAISSRSSWPWLRSVYGLSS